jgi:tRNA A58 N-methylase Trm61
MSDQSSVTSIDDDNTENFIENPSRELLAEGFLNFFSPIVENLDTKVKQTQ